MNLFSFIKKKIMGYFYKYKLICQTCGRRVGVYRNRYLNLKRTGKRDDEIFDKFKWGICCRASFMSGCAKFHDTERREVVDGEFPVGGKAPFYSGNKESIIKLKKNNLILSEKTSVPLTWDDEEIKVAKEKSLFKNKMPSRMKRAEEDVLSEFELPKIKKVQGDEDFYEDLDVQDEEEQVDKVITDFVMPTQAGFPTIYKPERLLKDDTLREISQGYIDKGGERIDMKTKMLNKIFYLAE